MVRVRFRAVSPVGFCHSVISSVSIGEGSSVRRKAVGVCTNTLLIFKHAINLRCSDTALIIVSIVRSSDIY